MLWRRGPEVKTGAGHVDKSEVNAVAVAASAVDDSGKKATLRPLMDLVGGDLQAVNALVVERMRSPVALIPQLAGHVVAAGGKRLRPLLTLASARLCGYTGIRHVALATCVEFIHTATLLHDDVVDDSDLRRGLASANAVFGNKASVLVGDFLFSRAFELMVEDGSLRVLEILSRASSVIAEGEVMQLMTTSNIATSEDDYLDVIRAKTAALFAAACEVGAVVADRPAEQARALRDYGLNLGIAFQLADDVLDYSAKQAEFGKTVGDDFRDGKITLPVVLALARGDEAERAFWERTLAEMDQQPADLDQAMALLHRHKALDDSLQRAHAFAAAAANALAVFPDSREKTVLSDLVRFCVDRAY